MQDDSFVGNLTCSSKPSHVDLTGTIRALCRICSNVTNPDNGLIMQGNFNCLPSSLLSSPFYCLYNQVRSLPECLPLLSRDRRNVSSAVGAVADTYYNVTDGGSRNLQYMAMGFRSVSCMCCNYALIPCIGHHTII